MLVLAQVSLSLLLGSPAAPPLHSRPAGRCAAPVLQFDLPDLGKAIGDAGKAVEDIGKTGSDFMSTMGLGGGATGLTKEEEQGMEKRLREGSMNFGDFLKQMEVMQRATHGAPPHRAPCTRCTADPVHHVRHR